MTTPGRRPPPSRGAAELHERLDDVERDTYRVFGESSGGPLKINPLAWLLIAVVVGLGLGRLASSPNPGRLLIVAGIIAFTLVAVLSPVRAVQAYLVLVITGQATTVGWVFGGTFLAGSDLLLFALLGGWLMSRRREGIGAAWPPGMALIVLGLAAICWALVGLGRGSPWYLVQIDLRPFLHLLAFFPLVDAARRPGGRRKIVAAVGLGLLLAALGSVATFVQYRGHSGTVVNTRFGIVFPEQGPGGAARVTLYADALLPLGLIGGLALSRYESVPRRRIFALAVATLCGFALLISYTRSLILPTLAVIVVRYVIRRREEGRWGRGTAAGVAVLILVAVLFPLLSGRSLGRTLASIEERFSATLSDESYEERAAESRAALRIFGRHVLVGAGFGVAAYIEGYPSRIPSLFHNLYAGLLAKTGMLGMIAFLTPLAFLLSRAVRFGRGQAEAEQGVRVAAAWLAGLLLAAPGTGYLFNPLGVLHIALTAALVAERMAAATGERASLVIGAREPAHDDGPGGPENDAPALRR